MNDRPTGRTLFAKIWDAHRVTAINETTDLILIDRVLLHERTGAAALGHRIRRLLRDHRPG